MCLPIIGAIVSAAGPLYSAMAQSAAYKAEEQAKKYEAQGQRNMGAYESARQDERNKRLTGQQVTAFASSGVELSGTPGMVIADARSEGEMDRQAIRYGAQFRSNLADYESKVAKTNAKTAKIGGAIGAISPTLTGLKTSWG